MILIKTLISSRILHLLLWKNQNYFTMRTFKTYNVIVKSVSELCRWLQRDDVSIVELVPTKEIDNEDVIKINFVRKEEEES